MNILKSAIARSRICTLSLHAVLLLAALHAAESTAQSVPNEPKTKADGGHMGIQHLEEPTAEETGALIAFDPPNYVPPINLSPQDDYGPEKCAYLVNLAIERAPKGRLWSSWYASRDQEDRFGFLCLSSSDDQGKSWSDIRLVIDPDKDGPIIPMDGNLWLDPQGRLWYFFTIIGINGKDLAKQGLDYALYGKSAYAIVTENPDDPTPVWSEPRFIATGHLLNKPIALTNGDWIMAVARWYHDPSILLIASTDAGETWSYRGGVTINPPDIRNCDEPVIVERKDGSLWVTARTKDGIYESTSRDGGRTWSEASKYQHHTVSRFMIRRLASGNLILLRHGNPQEDVGRTNTMAFLSDDDGKSWKGGLLLEEEYSSYPDISSQDPDGTIYVTFDRSRSELKKVLMSRFTESDILAGDFQSPNSETGLQVYQGTGTNRNNWDRDGRWMKKSWNSEAAPFREGAAAEIDAAPFEKRLMNQGVELFADRPYVADNIDDELIAMCIDPRLGFKGKRIFVFAPYEETKTVKVTEPGMIYLISRRDGPEAEIISSGFEKCAIQEFILFVRPENDNKAVENDFYSVYQKWVEIGDEVTFGPGTVLFF